MAFASQLNLKLKVPQREPYLSISSFFCAFEISNKFPLAIEPIDSVISLI